MNALEHAIAHLRLQDDIDAAWRELGRLRRLEAAARVVLELERIHSTEGVDCDDWDGAFAELRELLKP